MTSSGRSVKAPDRMKVVHAPSSKRKRRQATVPESDDDAPESDDDAPDGAGGAGGAGGKAAKPPRKKAARPAKESDFPEIGAALAASKKLEEDRVLLQDVQAVVRRADLPGKPGMLPEPRARYIDETTGESYSIQGNSESRALLRDNDSHAWEKTNAEHHRKAANTGEKYCPQRDPDNIVSKEQAAAATCIICAYVLDGDYTELDCSHAFCRGCIKTWTTTGKRKTCPVCRSHLDRRNLKQSGFFTGLINKLSCVCPHGPARKLRDKSPVAAAAAAAAASSSSATVVVAARVSSDKTEDGAPLTEQVPGVYCRWTGVYEEIGDHLKDDCKYAIGKPLFRVGCKYCSETFLVPQLEAHESNCTEGGTKCTVTGCANRLLSCQKHWTNNLKAFSDKDKRASYNAATTSGGSSSIGASSSNPPM